MAEVSDMLLELYKANVANAPKNQQSVIEKLRQNSPSSAESHEPSSIAAIATKGASAPAIESKNLQSDEMVKKPIEQQPKLTLTVKNLADIVSSNIAVDNSPFHQSTKYPNANIIQTTTNTEHKLLEVNDHHTNRLPSLSAIPVPVVVTPNSPKIDIKPLIHPTTGLVISAVPNQSVAPTNLSVIKTVPALSNIDVPALASLSSTRADRKSIQGHHNTIGNSAPGVDSLPQAAAIAAALLRDGYNNFHQQMRTQELMNEKGQNNMNDDTDGGDATTTNANISTKILESLLRQQGERRFKVENESNNGDTTAIDGDDEDDSRYNDFDDIHLVEHSKANCNNSSIFHPTASTSTARFNSTNFDYMSDDSQKIIFAAQAQALRNFEYSFSDGGNNSYGNMTNDGNMQNNENGDGIEAVYECRHCGKKYRWKSTLRRHENVECGGKEPSHQCPYCPYKSKQRGNLGVHVRKHHSDLPQLASKRRSKYSHKLDSSNNSANASDDSSSRLVIDCSK